MASNEIQDSVNVSRGNQVPGARSAVPRGSSAGGITGQAGGNVLRGNQVPGNKGTNYEVMRRYQPGSQRGGGLTTEQAAGRPPLQDEPILPPASPETVPAQLKLSNVRESLRKYSGPQKTNLFVVTIKNASNFLDSSFEARDLIYFCNKAILPGYGFSTSNNYKRYGVGVSELVPYDVMFTDTSLSFLGDGAGFLLNFFEVWGNSITSFFSAHDIAAPQPALGYSRVWEPGEVGYKSNFQTEIIIELLNTSLLTVTKYTLHKAFPVIVGGVNLSWGSMDEIMEINTTFTFQNWSSQKFKENTEVQANLPGMSFIQRALQLGSIAATFGAIGKPDSIADIIQLVNATNIIGFNSRTLLR